MKRFSIYFTIFASAFIGISENIMYQDIRAALIGVLCMEVLILTAKQEAK